MAGGRTGNAATGEIASGMSSGCSGSIEKFVLTILTIPDIYKEAEMIRIQNVLERLKNQKDIERQKYKGDNLLESGEMEEAILVYQAILNQEEDESVDRQVLRQDFLRTWGCLRKAVPLSGVGQDVRPGVIRSARTPMLEPYLYASYKYMSMEEYHILLTKNDDLCGSQCKDAPGDATTSEKKYRKEP